MSTRRMRIDDYELMGHARRRYLADLAELGDRVDDEQREHRDVLTQDTRLEGPLFMDWEIEPEVDRALVVALRRLLDTVADDLERRGIPAEELPLYVEGRKRAIQDTIARLSDS